jgi:hypothetical protein
MLKGFIALMRRHRRPVVWLAAGLLVLQALLAGLATAQAAVMLSGELGAGFAVICHGNGGASPDTGSGSDLPKDWHSCCGACTAGAAPAVLPALLDVAGASLLSAPASPRLRAASLSIVPRAVRAGPSQAPPSLD